MLISGLIICIWYIIRYANKVKGNPKASYVFSQKEEIEVTFLKNKNRLVEKLTSVQKVILVIFTSCFVIIIFGVSRL